MNHSYSVNSPFALWMVALIASFVSIQGVVMPKYRELYVCKSGMLTHDGGALPSD